MPLTRLVYFSKASGQLTARAVSALVKTARERNRALDVTGALLFDRNHFVQAIEGSRDVVNALFRKIVADGRHLDVTIVHCTAIAARRFADWTMKYSFIHAPEHAHLLRYAQRSTFDPALLGADAAVELLAAAPSSD